MKEAASEATCPDTPPPPVPPALGGTCPPHAKEDEPEEGFVPVAMITPELRARILMPLDDGDKIKILPNAETPRFFVILKPGRDIRVELSDELEARMFELSWKLKPDVAALTRSMMICSSLPRSPHGFWLDQMLVVIAETGICHRQYLYLAADALRRFELHFGAPILALLRSPPKSKERKKAASKLKNQFAAVIDALNLQSGKIAHGSLATVDVATEAGRIQKPIALLAIEMAKKYVAEHRAEPTKADIRKLIVDEYADYSRKEYSFWSKRWKEACLDGLAEKTPQ